MGQIQNGFALTIIICGVVYLVSSLISFTCGWLLVSKLTDHYYFTTASNDRIHFGVYWWGGCSLFIPGILGIIAACTKSISAMLAFLIFNILGMSAAIGCSVYVARILIVWVPLATLIKEHNCVTLSDTCSCFDVSEMNYYYISATCQEISSIETLLFAIIISVAFSAFVALISSYVSCCALCNTEQGSPRIVIQQPPAMVVMANTQINQSYQIQPQQPYYLI